MRQPSLSQGHARQTIKEFHDQPHLALDPGRRQRDDEGILNERRISKSKRNLSEIVRGSFQSAYLGYYALAPHAGDGYMSEGLELVLQAAFRNLKLHRVEANIQPRNAASLALVKRAGFRREGFSPRYLKVCGRWRDHERWAMLVDDWRAR